MDNEEQCETGAIILVLVATVNYPAVPQTSDSRVSVVSLLTNAAFYNCLSFGKLLRFACEHRN